MWIAPAARQPALDADPAAKNMKRAYNYLLYILKSESRALLRGDLSCVREENTTLLASAKFRYSPSQPTLGVPSHSSRQAHHEQAS